MYCEKLSYGKFSPELKKKLIEFGKQKLNNPNSVAGCTAALWKTNSEDDNRGYIYVYQIDQFFRREIEKYFDDNNVHHPEWKYKRFGVQVVTGNKNGIFPPHTDPINSRVKDFVYILDTGGDNVITTWWDLKDGSTTNVKLSTPVWYEEEILNEIEAHKTEEDTWYEFDFTEIHSVKNIQRLRVAFVTWESQVKNVGAWDDKRNIKGDKLCIQ